ncbi:DUF1659 domain-containing protein [Bacillus shivajii]|uniref:DUF1659 domain-containing protein n=1 Tax=Bacillus shivajii TaxID=1983719 RepID=UPI001CFA1BA0|nr:DUF1659 domain-containing protein [Bacillus shivajii]UCZ52046.1 DUF1659 domain-containing protein [Bacillus shivajii]
MNNEAMNTRLSITFVTGYDDDGLEMYQTRHFNNIHPASESEDLLQVANALASLQQHQLEKIERFNTYDLAE